jgi:anti-anti-sigma factor
VNLVVSTETEGGVDVLVLRGEVDIHTAPRFAKALQRVATQSTGHVVVDMADVSFMDSSGLGEIVRGYHELAAQDRRLAVAASQSATRRLFSMTGVDKLLAVADSRSEATEALQAE